MRPNTDNLNQFSAENYHQLFGIASSCYLFLLSIFLYNILIDFNVAAAELPSVFFHDHCFECVFNCFEQSVLAFEKCAVKA